MGKLFREIAIQSWNKCIFNLNFINEIYISKIHIYNFYIPPYNEFITINYDIHYVKNISFREDVKVILLTIGTVLSGKNADAGKSTIKNELDALKSQGNPSLIEERI